MTETTSVLVTVDQTVRIDATPETLWSYWTDPALLAEWWGTPSDLQAEPGGVLRIVMESGPTMLGSFVELDPPHRLVLGFGWEGNTPGEPLAPGSTRVEVTFTPDDDATLVRVRHHDMPSTHAEDHAKGWAHYVGERLPAAIADQPGLVAES